MPSVLEKIKSAYIVWHKTHVILPQVSRYTLGNKIDKLFLEIVEAIVTGTFLQKEDKIPYIRLAIRKLDTLKIFLMILWEIKAIENKRYILLSEPLEEVGRMLGGWHNSQVTKQNSPHK